jgi:hypothetical protein
MFYWTHSCDSSIARQSRSIYPFLTVSQSSRKQGKVQGSNSSPALQYLPTLRFPPASSMRNKLFSIPTHCSFTNKSIVTNCCGGFLTDGQPNCSMRYGAISKPIKEPTCNPPKEKEIARDLSSVEIIRAIMSVVAEGATASPIPTSTLERNRPASGASESVSLARLQYLNAVP